MYVYVHVLYNLLLHWTRVPYLPLIVISVSAGGLYKAQWTDDGQLIAANLKNGRWTTCTYIMYGITPTLFSWVNLNLQQMKIFPYKLIHVKQWYKNVYE